MSDYFILDGHTPIPVSVKEWAISFERDNRIVGRDQIGDILVSTVFLGLNHNFDPDGPPLLFETMVFGLPDVGEPCWRYHTWEEAEAAHKIIVDAVISGQDLNTLDIGWAEY